ncbi:short chain dehydrogenase [Motiliproteus coralliicola]|uniref:Short chain dehydrogenase n=1 Tax=Motiliproteus coralliicola TaxID=2283196 RepID=A0A369WRX5_9GAMM|nr:SDR family oxidoreductase [Motiliproteus coralliicola]RDE24878.1 short chain dehydrogenase [Motiliproteus coralliicola]
MTDRLNKAAISEQVIIITGASRGIGAACARLIADRGYRVVVNYRQQADKALQLVDQIIHRGGQAKAICADVANEAEVETLFQQADQFGKLYGLVNNAGILDRQARLDELDAARLQRLFQVNVVGSFLCAKQAVKRMSTRYGGEGGAIVNLSSVAARLGAPGEYIDYAATKGAIDTMTLGLSKEVAAEGIRVNAVRPGIIYTDIHADGGEPGRVDRLGPSLPMQRGGRPEEVAEAVLWLLSEQASYITGNFIDAAGGR